MTVTEFADMLRPIITPAGVGMLDANPADRPIHECVVDWLIEIGPHRAGEIMADTAWADPVGRATLIGMIGAAGNAIYEHARETLDPVPRGETIH